MKMEELTCAEENEESDVPEMWSADGAYLHFIPFRPGKIASPVARNTLHGTFQLRVPGRAQDEPASICFEQKGMNTLHSWGMTEVQLYFR